MIISKRKFNEEIEKAVAKKEAEMWERRNHEDEMRDVWHRFMELDDRVRKLEKPNESSCENEAVTPRNY